MGCFYKHKFFESSNPRMKIFIFLMMYIGQALSDNNNTTTLKAAEQKAFDDLIMAIMHDESIFYSFMLRSSISRDSLTRHGGLNFNPECLSLQLFFMMAF